MPVTKERTLDYVELEWGTYVERFNRLPKDEGNKRVKAMGYESLRDLLAHLETAGETAEGWKAVVLALGRFVELGQDA